MVCIAHRSKQDFRQLFALQVFTSAPSDECTGRLKRSATLPSVKLCVYRWKACDTVVAWAMAVLLAVLLAVLTAVVMVGCTPASPHEEKNVESAAIPFAVMGDSDSHSYQDRIWLPAGEGEPGGPYRKQTFQWTEVLAQLRSKQLDLGAWGIWGERKSWVRVKELFSQPGRAPRKEDFEHNFALGGSRCEALTTGIYRQAPRLVNLMDRHPARWQRGVVVVRIGIIDIGLADSLDALSRNAADAGVRARTLACLGHIREAVNLIHASHPQTHIVLVGILDNTDHPAYAGQWKTATEFDNIRAGLDVFDAGLQQIAANRPDRIAFFDDRTWFSQRWGSLGGRKSATPAPGLSVRHAMGDSPEHSVLANGHAGLAWNLMWARSLVELLNERFALGIAPINDDEASAYLARLPPTR